jgi:hypothetical protein
MLLTANLAEGRTAQIQGTGTTIRHRHNYRTSSFSVCDPEASAQGIAGVGRNIVVGIVGPAVGHTLTRETGPVVGRRLGRNRHRQG